MDFLLTEQEKRAKLEREQQAAKQAAGELEIVLGGGAGKDLEVVLGQPPKDSKALTVLGQVDPQAAQLMAGVVDRASPQEMKEVRDEATRSMKLAGEIQNAGSFAKQQAMLADETARVVSQGGDTSRLVTLSNMDEAHLGLEMDKMGVVGQAMLDAVPEKKTKTGPLNALSSPEKIKALSRLGARDPKLLAAVLKERGAALARQATAAEQEREAALPQSNLGKQIADIKALNLPKAEEGRALDGLLTKAASAGRGGGKFTKAPGVVVQLPDGSFAQSIPVLDETTGATVNKIVPIEGQPVSRQFGETGFGLTERKIREAGGKTRATKAETRLQGHIDKGIDAADQVSVINRSLELLATVETGGIDAANLRAQQFLGVEGADEAELSANLGKAMISQLRDVFGAQFTEREGGELKRIEAGFGKSTEGNLRLLKRTKKLLMRAARRGIMSAERSGDFESADEIRDALEFSLTPGDQNGDIDGDTSGSTTPSGIKFRIVE